MDPITQFQAISEELDEHAKRLGERAGVIANLAEQEQDPRLSQVLRLIAESFREQVDTGLDFQRELIVKVAEVVSTQPEVDADLGIEETDADQILEVLNEHLALLEAGLKTMPADTPAAARAEWEAKVKKCKGAIELVDGYVIEDDEDGGEEDDGAADN